MSTLAAQALQQALVAAARDPAGRARAVHALRGSEVYATTWPTDPSSLRTLQNSSGIRALALFTDERNVEDAGLRFGWLGVDGRAPLRRLHISEAIAFARRERVAMVIVDITSDHALELDQGEMELVAASPSSRPPSYAGIAPVVSSARRVETGSEVTRVSSRPPPPERSNESSGIIPTSALKPATVKVRSEEHAVSATFAPVQTVSMTALEVAPPDALIEALTQLLREYPEIEWACFVGGEESGGDASTAVALRIDRAFRKHLLEISLRLRETCAAQGATCKVLVLDTPEQMKRARHIGLPFYPWRKRQA